MSKLYIALNQTSESTIFHWAIIPAHTDNLIESFKVYHIRIAGGPWESGNNTIELLSIANFVCCVMLPDLIVPLANAETVLAAQPVEQGSTPLISYYQHWSCEQWVLRAISDLVAQKCLPDAFTLATSNGRRYHTWISINVRIRLWLTAILVGM